MTINQFCRFLGVCLKYESASETQNSQTKPKHNWNQTSFAESYSPNGILEV